MSPSRSQSPDCDHVLHRLPEVAAGGSVWSGYRPDGIDEAARQQRQEVEAGRGPLRILAPGRVEHLHQRRAVWVAVTGRRGPGRRRWWSSSCPGVRGDGGQRRRAR